jgi:hypothetical protein
VVFSHAVKVVTHALYAIMQVFNLRFVVEYLLLDLCATLINLLFYDLIHR